MRLDMDARKFAIVPPPEGKPMPTVWSDRMRGAMESALDSESAISLACHVNKAFVESRNWADLVAKLARRGFHLRFEGRRLVMVNELTGLSLCTCASLGHSFAALSRRFGKPCVLAGSGRLVGERSRG